MNPHDQAILHGSGQSTWRTPPPLFEKLSSAVGGFLIDAAANRENALCPVWFGPGGTAVDGLSADWAEMVEAWKERDTPERIFLNPPYSKKERKALMDAGASPHDPEVRALWVDAWAEKAWQESLRGVSSVALLPYAPQTDWFRTYVMGHSETKGGWLGHAALDYWRIPHRVSFLSPDGLKAANAGVNHCVVHWGPNPGFVGPWVPSGRYWSYR